MKTQLTRRTFLSSALAALAFGAGIGQAQAAINVVTTVPELAAIAREVGGANVSVYSIARPNRDYHIKDALPSDVQRVARAKLLVATGMDLELWFSALMNAAGNRNLNRGGVGYVDASQGVRRLEVPTSQVSGASGDIHVDGNPHFFYDPIYAKFIARNILKGLIRVDAAHAEAYRANYSKFNAEMDRRMAGYIRILAPYRGRSLVTYHRNYAYFLRRFGLREFGTLEDKPGIPPSAQHVNQLIQNMKAQGIKAVVIESIYPTRYPALIQRQTGAKFVVAPYSVGSLGTTNYFTFMDKLVESFRQALAQ